MNNNTPNNFTWTPELIIELLNFKTKYVSYHPNEKVVEDFIKSKQVPTVSDVQELLAEVLQYFNKDTTNVPQGLYKEVFNFLYPPLNTNVPERIKVKDLGHYGINYYFTLEGGDIPVGKYEEVKKAIEIVLNRDTAGRFDGEKANWFIIDEIGQWKTPDKEYTKKEIDKILTEFKNQPLQFYSTPKRYFKSEVDVVAVKIAESVNPKLTAQEQALFIAGFQECIKWQNQKPQPESIPTLERQDIDKPKKEAEQYYFDQIKEPKEEQPKPLPKQMWDKYTGIHDENHDCKGFGCQEYNPLNPEHKI